MPPWAACCERGPFVRGACHTPFDGSRAAERPAHPRSVRGFDQFEPTAKPNTCADDQVDACVPRLMPKLGEVLPIKRRSAAHMTQPVMHYQVFTGVGKAMDLYA